jgi:hypothetical protein
VPPFSLTASASKKEKPAHVSVARAFITIGTSGEVVHLINTLRDVSFHALPGWLESFGSRRNVHLPAPF